MDLNKDGIADILSGTYSHDGDGDMAGHFYALYGKKDGTFVKATKLLGPDKKPLTITPDPKSKDADIERICTRPYAADMNGDGHLDIVSGNFGGTFAVFWGKDGGGFSPKSEYLKDSSGTLLRVGHHSDPNMVDWDNDGDLDLVSGSDIGDVWLFLNEGSKTAHKFSKPISLYKGKGHADMNAPLKFGEAHLTAPQRSTRVAVVDVNKDGLLDLYIGDHMSIVTPVKGLSEEECKKKLAELQKEEAKVATQMPEIKDWENMTAEEEAAMEKFQKTMEKFWKKRQTIVSEKSSGTVWLLLQKK